jgi:hypothetical protein
MPRRLALRMLPLTMALLLVGGAMLWRAPVACAEPTMTVYQDPT